MYTKKISNVSIIILQTYHVQGNNICLKKEKGIALKGCVFTSPERWGKDQFRLGCLNQEGTNNKNLEFLTGMFSTVTGKNMQR